MTNQKTHLKNRDLMIGSLISEIFGPDDRIQQNMDNFLKESVPLDMQGQVSFASWDEYNKNHVVAGSRQEILKNESPMEKYGMGILFPEAGSNEEERNEDQTTAQEAQQVILEEGLSQTQKKNSAKLRKHLLDKADKVSSLAKGEDDSGLDLHDDESDLRLSNLRKPRCIGISFIADIADDGVLNIQLSGGRYHSITATINPEESRQSEQTLWVRTAVKEAVEIPFGRIRQKSDKIIKKIELIGGGEAKIPLTIELVSRQLPDQLKGEYSDDCRLLTVSVVNRARTNRTGVVQHSLFQSRLIATPKPDNGINRILEYPRPSLTRADHETQSFELLYRNERTFSTGHGCAGEWDSDESAERARSVTAEPVPSYETPSITPNLEDKKDGETLKIHIAPLAGLVEGDDGIEQINKLIKLYDEWINKRKVEAAKLNNKYQKAAERHINECLTALQRMKDGLDLINGNQNANLAFKLTNRAMLIQQLCGSLDKRIVKYNREEKRHFYSREYKDPDLNSKAAMERSWRPFQIAFLLMNIPSLLNQDGANRELVDLIWFPTGGGKTEAYLAAAAFSLFLRRMRNNGDKGTDIIMRYTLRLLTAQQFQRASGLICAMESIRNKKEDLLGSHPFSIGIWVGGETTPNSIKDAKTKLNDTRRYGPERYPLVLLRCPWCGTEIGPKENRGAGRLRFELLGVNTTDITLHCNERKCPFNSGLPVWTVDEQIYRERPSLIIGTVDKFATLAWRPEARSLFGIEDDGQRLSSPPGMIIQDELHLITGPLGSMVGLYETVIDELCTDRRNANHVVKPKIICATATTRASNRQILDLFGRDKASIFPPPGLDAGDSFFAKYERDPNTGNRKPGRLYMGILPVNYSSALTASVRSFSAVITAAGMLPDDEKDQWWSLLIFYNSLRELGGGLTLFASDIPERLNHVQRRWTKKGNRRWINKIIELTGRLTNSEVPQALEELETNFGNNRYPVDACLASNIIEVGVDVNRLGLMSVMGQPKTTAQYIQATGRVGRTLPGLIFTLYATTKPRDRSHYEQFRTYHSRLYSQVEPSSLTPFSRPLLERAAHAILCAWVRQTMPKDEINLPADPVPVENIKNAMKAMISRQKLLSSRDKTENEAKYEAQMLIDILKQRADEWAKTDANIWNKWKIDPDSADHPLLRYAGAACRQDLLDKSWPTPTSMRGVDAETTPVISDLYRKADEANEASNSLTDFFNEL